MEYLVWVGPRDSDMKFSKSIKECICYYSNNNPLLHRKSNIYGKTFITFIEIRINAILQDHPEARFIFYNPKIAYSLSTQIREHVLCLNDKYILDLLSDKIYMRYWLGNYVPVLPSLIQDAHNLSFKVLEKKLQYSKAYVAQKNRSSGGFGTFYITRDNNILSYIHETCNELLIVSPYIENNLSINVTALISEKQFTYFPASLQIVEEDDNRLIYHGADFISIRNLSFELHSKINNYSEIILTRLKSLGYRGIIGIDFIIKGNDVYFLELNPRYQASSFLIDAALTSQGYCDLTELNIAFFYNHEGNCLKTQDLFIDYSFYKFYYKEGARHLFHIESVAKNNPYVFHVCLDGWNKDAIIEKDAYCYAIIFKTNITSINFDGGYYLYSNITGEELYLKKNLSNKIGLKIALLNQGCIISKSAFDFLSTKGIIKKAVFSSIDFQLSNGLYVNTPVNLKFTDFSPFSICINSNKNLELRYYDSSISEIKLEMQADWTNLQTSKEIPYRNIAYLSTDRLRLKHETVCDFKKHGKGCSFCGIPVSRTQFSLEDIKEVINTLLPNPSFRHILIGGGSGDPHMEYKQIIDISKFIRRINSDIPIYLMSLPPTNKEVLKKYQQVGITEVAFNIEIWDRDLARQLMPGKGEISLETYLDILNESTKLWGKTGNVRTALIVGLDKTESLLKGVRILCQNGIQPMLSVFRPMKNTKLESLVPPSNQSLLSLYKEARNICLRYNLKLGPTCDACKNNMLAI